MSWGYQWRPYVSVAQRRAIAARAMAALKKKGVDIQPVNLEGRTIARTFWGQAWCDHLESFSDYENRLPRGRTYVRNGSVCHLAISKGLIEAKVSGSEIYTVRIRIKTLPAKKWADIKRQCSGQIGSLLELLQGKLSDGVMEVVTNRQNGLFPLPGEISLDCSCPDWATMCKHVAAVLYGVGARLDRQPELLFTLRDVDHEELIAADAERAVAAATKRGRSKRLTRESLSDVFGIDLAVNASASSDASSAKPSTDQSPRRSVTKAKVAKLAAAAKTAAKKVAPQERIRAALLKARKTRGSAGPAETAGTEDAAGTAKTAGTAKKKRGRRAT